MSSSSVNRATMRTVDAALAVGSKCMRDAISACLCRYFASTAVEPDVNVKRVQAVRIGVLIVMSAHWVGCIYYGLARTWNFDSSTWLAGFEKIIPLYRAGEAEVWFEYLLCVYKGFNRLTALGYEGTQSDLLGHDTLSNACCTVCASHTVRALTCPALCIPVSCRGNAQQ